MTLLNRPIYAMHHPSEKVQDVKCHCNFGGTAPQTKIEHVLGAISK